MTEALELVRRDAVGKRSLKKLRSEGLVPAIVYSRESETTPVQIDAKILGEYLDESGRIVDLVLDGKSLKAVVKEIQHEALSDAILHIDFLLVSLTEKIILPVSVVLSGELPFPPDQGTLEQILNDVEIECLPSDAPDELKVDISGLKPGGSIHVSELELPPRVVMITPGEDTVATVIRPSEEEEKPAEEAGEEPQEPEVIGGHKEDKKEPE